MAYNLGKQKAQTEDNLNLKKNSRFFIQEVQRLFLILVIPTIIKTPCVKLPFIEEVLSQILEYLWVMTDSQCLHEILDNLFNLIHVVKDLWSLSRWERGLWYWCSAVIHFSKPGYSSKRLQFVKKFSTQFSYHQSFVLGHKVHSNGISTTERKPFWNSMTSKEFRI